MSLLCINKKAVFKFISTTSTLPAFFKISSRTIHSYNIQPSIKLLNKKFNKMIRVRLNETEQKVNISLKCLVNADTEREFNLNRSLDEPISATFQKLYSNFIKQVKSKDARSNKKLKVANKNSLFFTILYLRHI
jgi:hypothetical protein